MAYSYLLDLYRVLAEREKEIKQRQEASSGSLETEKYLQGRLAAINEFSSYLKDNFHSQLPRRLRRTIGEE